MVRRNARSALLPLRRYLAISHGSLPPISAFHRGPYPPLEPHLNPPPW